MDNNIKRHYPLFKSDLKRVGLKSTTLGVGWFISLVRTKNMKARITICLNENLLEDIDEKKGRFSRSQFIEDLLLGYATLFEENQQEVSGYV